MSQSESGGLQAQVIPSHFLVFIWSGICASGVIWSWLILTLPSVTVCPHFSSLHVSQASELHSSIDRILQTSVPSVDHSFILEWVDCLFQDSDVWLALRSLYYFGVLPSFFPRTLNQSQVWHMNVMYSQSGWQLIGGSDLGFCLCFKLDPSTQSRISVTFPSFLALIPPPSPSYPSFSITFS